MTKKRKWFFILTAAVILLIAMLCWYFMPVHLLRGVNPSEITRIQVFDGNTGKGFDITDAEDIDYIVGNIQSTAFQRGSVSLGYSGYRFRMSFYNVNGDQVQSFILNSADSIRKDPFFYRSTQGTLCVEHLWELEEALA